MPTTSVHRPCFRPKPTTVKIPSCRAGVRYLLISVTYTMSDDYFFHPRPDTSQALYQPGQKILPPLNHLFGSLQQGTSGPDFRNSNPATRLPQCAYRHKISLNPEAQQAITFMCQGRQNNNRNQTRDSENSLDTLCSTSCPSPRISIIAASTSYAPN